MPNNENGLWFLNFPNGPSAATFNAPMVSVDVDSPSEGFAALKNKGVSGSAQDLFFYSFDKDFEMDEFSVTLTDSEFARISVLQRDFVVDKVLDVKMHVELGDNPPGIHTLISRWQAGRESFEIFIDAEGHLNFTKVARNHYITKEPGEELSQTHVQRDNPTASNYRSEQPFTKSWLRVTQTLSDEGTEVMFLQSDDPGNWNIIGTDSDNALDFATTGDHINVMGSEFGSVSTAGKVYELEINNIKVDFADALPTQAHFVSNGNEVEFHFKDAEGYDPEFSRKRDKPYVYIPEGKGEANITLPLTAEFVQAPSYDLRVSFANKDVDYELLHVGDFSVRLFNDHIIAGNLTSDKGFASVTDSDVVGFRFTYDKGVTELYLGYPRFEGAGVDNFIWVGAGSGTGKPINDYSDLTVGTRASTREHSMTIYDFSLNDYSFDDGVLVKPAMFIEDTSILMNNKTKMRLPLKGVDVDNLTVGARLSTINKSAKPELISVENGVGWTLGFDERGYPKFVVSDGNETVTVKGKIREKGGPQRLVARLSREDNTASIYLNGTYLASEDISELGSIETDADLIIGGNEIAFYSLELWDEAVEESQVPAVMDLGFSGYPNGVEWGLWHVGVQQGGPPPSSENFSYDSSLLDGIDIIEYV